VGEKLHKNINL